MSYVFTVTHDDVRRLEDEVVDSIYSISLDKTGCDPEASDEQFTVWTSRPGYNGGLHRGENKPATIYENYLFLWYVYNIAHRVDGPSRADFKHKDFSYSLFGVDLEPILFYNTQDHWRKFGCPLWVSLFVVTDLISEETFSEFIMDDGKWKCDLPFDWILKIANITDDRINETLEVPPVPMFLKHIVKITEFMDAEKMKAEVSHAS